MKADESEEEQPGTSELMDDWRMLLAGGVLLAITLLSFTVVLNAFGATIAWATGILVFLAGLFVAALVFGGFGRAMT